MMETAFGFGYAPEIYNAFMKIWPRAEVGHHVEVILVFGNVVDGGDVKVRREKLEYLGFCEKALGIKGVSGCFLNVF